MSQSISVMRYANRYEQSGKNKQGYVKNAEGRDRAGQAQ